MTRSSAPDCPIHPRDNLPRKVTPPSPPRPANPQIAALTEVVEANCRTAGVLSHPPLPNVSVSKGGRGDSLSREAGEGRGGGSYRRLPRQSNPPGIDPSHPGAVPNISDPIQNTWKPSRDSPTGSELPATRSESKILNPKNFEPSRDSPDRPETFWDRVQIPGTTPNSRTRSKLLRPIQESSRSAPNTGIESQPLRSQSEFSDRLPKAPTSSEYLGTAPERARDRRRP